jgi:uncharacterized membrane protein
VDYRSTEKDKPEQTETEKPSVVLTKTREKPKLAQSILVTGCGLSDGAFICIVTGCALNDWGLISIVTGCGIYDGGVCLI